jgi:hypothetical protein
MGKSVRYLSLSGSVVQRGRAHRGRGAEPPESESNLPSRRIAPAGSHRALDPPAVHLPRYRVIV